jgi:hypothetical protein
VAGVTDLLVLEREFDLPPRWDGAPVEWEPWQAETPMFVCPPPKDMGACRDCGSLESRVTAKGIVTPLPGVHRIGGHQLRAFRCPDCQHDQVWDSLTDEVWDLDPDDYSMNGSWPPDDATPPPDDEDDLDDDVDELDALIAPPAPARPAPAPRRTMTTSRPRGRAAARPDGSCRLCDDLHAPGTPCGRPSPPPPGWRPTLKGRDRG